MRVGPVDGGEPHDPDTALIHLLLICYIAMRFARRKPAPEEEHRRFVDALATTQTASQVYEDEISNDGAALPNR